MINGLEAPSLANHIKHIMIHHVTTKYNKTISRKNNETEKREFRLLMTYQSS